MRKPRFVSLGRIMGVAAAPLALALLAQPASAQWHAQQQSQQPSQQQRYPNQRSSQNAGGSREIFEWQGSVDKEIRVQMAGSRTAVVAIGNNERALGRARAMGGVPAQDGYVTVQTLQGRGSADVVQQPSANNGYTTIVRVRDPQSGAAPYRIAAYWQPTGNAGSYGNNGVYRNGTRRNGNRDDQGYQGNDNGNHKDRGRHLGQRKHDNRSSDRYDH